MASNADEGVRFVYEPPSRQLKFKIGKSRSPRQESLSPMAPPTTVIPEVEIMVEEGLGAPKGFSLPELKRLKVQLRDEAGEVMRLALLNKAERDPRYKLPRMSSLSLVLCGDVHIRALNLQHRNKDASTDVLSFEMEDALDYKVHLPMKLLGDVVVSLDTAGRQAEERNHELLDEVRILLVHGILHLCGYDHEKGEKESKIMAEEERKIMDSLGWKGEGLITAVTREDGPEDLDDEPLEPQGSARGRNKAVISKPSADGVVGLGSIWVAAGMGGENGPELRRSKEVRKAAEALRAKQLSSPTVIIKPSRPKIKIVALDMDGTLLDAKSKIRPSSVAAIKAACEKGVRVILATGKARPAAIQACEKVGLVGQHLLVSTSSPGIFLQGLAVHGPRGESLFSSHLTKEVVEEAFKWSLASGVSLAAFHGDTCSTLTMTRELQELHSIYYEPLATVMPSLQAICDGPPVKKLLFQSDPREIAGRIKPTWESLLAKGDASASVMQAVPSMIEIVPRGVDKWQGMVKLLDRLKMDRSSLMAVGDGGNDMTLVKNAGVGVAMANAVKEVKAVASYVTTLSHDDDGVAEAFERFIL